MAAYSRRSTASGYSVGDIEVVEDIRSTPVRTSTTSAAVAEQVMSNLAGELAANERAMCDAIVREVQRTLAQHVNGKHSEMLEAITNIVVDPPDLSPIMEAIGSVRASLRHNELMEAVTNIVVDPPDLTPILAAVERVGMHEKHTEVLDAITNIVVDPPDLTPLEAMFRDIKAEIRQSNSDLKQEMSSMQQQMSELRSQNDALRSLVVGMEPRLNQSLSEILAAIKRLPAPADAAAIANVVVDRLRKTPLTMDTSEILQALKRLEVDPQAIASATLEKCKKYDFGHSEVLAAVRKIKMEPIDYEALANLLHERLKAHDFGHGEVLNAVRKIKIKETDLTPVLDAINNSEVDLNPVHEAIRRIPVYDHTAVITAINGIQIDHDAIADRVHSRVRDHDFGHSEVLHAVKRINNAPDHDAIASAVHERVSGMDFGHGEVLQALKRIKIKETDLSPVIDAINASEVDLTPIHEAITNIDIKVDLREVLQAIRHLNLNVDYDAIAESVAQRLDYDEMMKALRRLRPERPDLEPIIDAIRQIDLDLSPIMDAISKMNIRVDTSELMQAITSMRYSLEQLRVDSEVRVSEVVVREPVPMAPPPHITVREPVPMAAATVQPVTVQTQQVPMATAAVYGVMPQSPRLRAAPAVAAAPSYPAVSYNTQGSTVFTACSTPSRSATIPVYETVGAASRIERSTSAAHLRAHSSSPQPQQSATAQETVSVRSARGSTHQPARSRSVSAFAPAAVEIANDVQTPRYARRSGPTRDAVRRF